MVGWLGGHVTVHKRVHDSSESFFLTVLTVMSIYMSSGVME